MRMDAPNNEFVLVGSLEELEAKGRLVVQGGHGPILLVYDRGRVFALDNRCPHMGFPLERGTVEDGILTCHWHHARFDLESGCTFDLESTSELADLFAAGRGSRDWSGHAALAQELLGDDPARIVDALKEAIRAGAAPADLGQSLAYAAALRVARFGNANEHADWETANHAFSYANAVHQMLTRSGTANIDTHVTAVRGVLHGAMALYLARYLNVPPARIPGDGGEQLDDLPADPETIGAALLDAFDRQRQVDLAARLVARHLTLGHSPQALIATLAHAVLREDAGFHAYQ